MATKVCIGVSAIAWFISAIFGFYKINFITTSAEAIGGEIVTVTTMTNLTNKLLRIQALLNSTAALFSGLAFSFQFIAH